MPTADGTGGAGQNGAFKRRIIRRRPSPGMVNDEPVRTPTGELAVFELNPP